MPLPAALSAVVAVVALLCGLLALGLSRGPGWREFRWFGFSALAASAYAASQLPVTLSLDAATFLALQRFGIAAAAVHGAARIRYIAATERRPLSRVERGLIAIGIGCGTLAFLPGAVFRNTVSTHVWQHFRYEEPDAGLLGIACFAYFVFATGWIVRGHLAAAWRGEREARWHAGGAIALSAAAANDSAVGLHLYDGPYLLDIGFLAVVLTAGVTIAQHVLSDARALQASSGELARAEAELVERERLAALGELAAVVAHEVRNPVAVIFNALATMKPSLPSRSAEETALLAMIGEEASRLNRMVTVLLDFARPQPLDRRVAALDDIVRSALAAARIGCAAPQTRIDVTVHDGDVRLACEEQLVHQAFVNLISNAIAAPHRRTAVRVIVDPRERDVDIRVIDDGDGVSTTHLARLFTPFFTTRPTGTGLGLAVVARIARAHGGAVRHEQTPGGGATFVISLPRSTTKSL